MSTQLLIVSTGAFATIIAALLTYFLTKRKEINLKALEFKLDKYNDFLSGFAELGSSYKSYEAHYRMANTSNLLNMIASKEVLEKIYALFEFMKRAERGNVLPGDQERITDAIIIAMRKDLKVKSSNLKGFNFRLLSPGIKPGEVIQT